MFDSPTTAQTEHYRQHGFVHVPGMLDTNELTAWRTAIDEAVAERRGKPLDGKPAGHREGAYPNVFLQMMLLSRSSDAVRELMYDARLGRFAATLADIEGIRIWH